MSNKALTVWVVDDDQSVRWVLEKALRQAGMETQTFARAEHLLEAMQSASPDVLITDVRMPGMSGFALLDRLHSQHPGLPIIVITAHSDLESAVAAYKGGAFEYLPKPFEVDEVVAVVGRAIAQVRETTQPVEQPQEPEVEIIGRAPAMQEVFRAIGRLSKSNVTVLINGQSGTGKELVAQALHTTSNRKHKPFVPVNCAAINRELVESELFGHEKGAFTGADSRRIGRFEAADGGTIFLDEIGDMAAETQAKVLRVLEERCLERVGSSKSVEVDVRVVSATHRDLEDEVAEGKFREDLYYRLNVVEIAIPALRERLEDLPALVERFLSQVAKRLQREKKGISEPALARLARNPWRGNVRELRNAVERAIVMGESDLIRATDLPPDVRASAGSFAALEAAENVTSPVTTIPTTEGPLPLRELERRGIIAALAATNGNKAQAANLLKIDRSTLYKKIKDYDLG